ncbi:MAG: hypothetical protein IJ379_05730 [Lachnospiraceae bacterium]|nr:hypothetical protein [Lachnospiraceae bacterium]
MTVIYSLLHMLVDGVCALAMFGYFVQGEDGHFAMLLYNFCAFALQMPLGILLDILVLQKEGHKEKRTLGFALTGVVVTVAGAFLHPVILGIGNALFHIGGGVGSIQEDRAKRWNGRGLGVFVAPGAFGLYIGTLLAKKGVVNLGLAVACGLLLVFSICAGMQLRRRKDFMSADRKTSYVAQSGQTKVVILAFCCFVVVVLRSYIGMAVSFPWKQMPVLAGISVLAVVCGKAAGGFFAAKYGHMQTAVLTLILAGIGYVGLEIAPLGLAALFLFNMTMPMTLYLLICAMPEVPGFSFGLLTFGLFLGFLPEYFGVQLPLSAQALGCMGSIVSMVILVCGIWIGGRQRYVSD